MFVMVRIEVTEEERGRIRAGEGRYGLATRDEVRGLALERFAAHVRTLPAPKKRRSLSVQEAVQETRAELDHSPDTSAIAAAFGAPAADIVTDDTVCERCGYRRGEHVGAAEGSRRVSCPLSKSVKPGSTFKARQALEVSTW